MNNLNFNEHNCRQGSKFMTSYVKESILLDLERIKHMHHS